MKELYLSYIVNPTFCWYCMSR